jgi:hypothetical protein
MTSTNTLPDVVIPASEPVTDAAPEATLSTTEVQSVDSTPTTPEAPKGPSAGDRRNAATATMIDSAAQLADGVPAGDLVGPTGRMYLALPKGNALRDLAADIGAVTTDLQSVRRGATDPAAKSAAMDALCVFGDFADDVTNLVTAELASRPATASIDPRTALVGRIAFLSAAVAEVMVMGAKLADLRDAVQAELSASGLEAPTAAELAAGTVPDPIRRKLDTCDVAIRRAADAKGPRATRTTSYAVGTTWIRDGFTLEAVADGFVLTSGGIIGATYPSLTAACKGAKGSNTSINGAAWWAAGMVHVPAGVSDVATSDDDDQDDASDDASDDV